MARSTVASIRVRRLLEPALASWLTVFVSYPVGDPRKSDGLRLARQAGCPDCRRAGRCEGGGCAPGGAQPDRRDVLKTETRTELLRYPSIPQSYRTI